MVQQTSFANSQRKYKCQKPGLKPRFFYALVLTFSNSFHKIENENNFLKTTIMKTKFRFLMYGLFALAVTLTSCEKEGPQGPIGPAGSMGEQGIAGPNGPAGEDGEDGEALGVPGPIGATGADGSDGTNGTNGAVGEDGTNGTSGVDGENGTNGTNGTDGEDGNANVQNFVIDVSNFTGSTINRTMSAITQDAIDNDVILGYLKRSGGNYAPVPAPNYLVKSGVLHDVAVDLNVGKFVVIFYETGSEALASVSTGDLDKLRVIVAKSTSTTSGKSSREGLQAKMKSAGVDINDYYSVMDYFGLDH